MQKLKKKKIESFWRQIELKGAYGSEEDSLDPAVLSSNERTVCNLLTSAIFRS